MDFNHIVSDHPYPPTYDEWKEYYKNELDSMFIIFENEFKEELDINIEVFNKFCKFMYNNSSKKLNEDPRQDCI